ALEPAVDRSDASPKASGASISAAAVVHQSVYLLTVLLDRGDSDARNGKKFLSRSRALPSDCCQRLVAENPKCRYSAPSSFGHAPLAQCPFHSGIRSGMNGRCRRFLPAALRQFPL